MVVSFVRCADAFSADDSSAVTSLHNSLRKPNTELAKYLEFAEVNHALGKCTKSQRCEELQSVLAVTDEALSHADTLSSDRYNELAAECNRLIQDDNSKAAKRALQ